MPIGTWAPPTPEYLTAPGYQTYAPTAAYAYSPTGGDWSGAYPGYGGGGGGGGGLTSGDFGGGTDTSTLGNALSALSLLGGANNLSSFLTGKSLLEHAGISNPFSGLLDGGGGLNLEALNPYSNTPLTALFGEGGRNLGLASSQFPNALPGGVGGSVGIGPSGYLSPDALAGKSYAASPGSPSLLPGSTYGNAAPLTPYDVQTLPNNLNVPEAWDPATGEFHNYVTRVDPGTKPLSDFAGFEGAAQSAPGGNVLGEIKGVSEPWRSLNPAPPAANVPPGGWGAPTAGPYGPNPAFTEAALNTLVPGYSTTLGAAATAAGMSPGLTSAYMTGAIPEFAGLSFGAAPPVVGAAGTGAGGLAGLGAMGPLALAGAGLALMQARRAADPFDPTGPARRTNDIENMLQGGGGEHELTKKFGAGIEGLEEMLYSDPYSLQLIKDVTDGGNRADPFGTVRQSGATTPVAWSPNVAALVQENMHRLEAASAAGQAAANQGVDTPLKQAAYSDIKKGATFNAANDPFGHREREAAAGGEYGDFPPYIPSGRDLNALSYQDEFTR